MCYVRGLLLGQGLTWLILAVAGLTAWIIAFPSSVNLIADGWRLFWDGLELLAVVIAACMGSAQVVMACRLAGGQPRLLLGAALGLQGLMLVSGLIVTAALVTVGGSLLELSALPGGLAHAAHAGTPSAASNAPEEAVPSWGRYNGAGTAQRTLLWGFRLLM